MNFHSLYTLYDIIGLDIVLISNSMQSVNDSNIEPGSCFSETYGDLHVTSWAWCAYP